jgi:hypothetical protein
MWAGGGSDDLVGVPIGARRREVRSTNGCGVKWPGRGVPFTGLRQ